MVVVTEVEELVIKEGVMDQDNRLKEQQSIDSEEIKVVKEVVVMDKRVQLMDVVEAVGEAEEASATALEGGFMGLS